jgi:hypothetical protein
MNIDLSKYNTNRGDFSEIERFAKENLSKKIGKKVEELSVDHFYDMSDFGGSKDLYVLEISYEYDEDLLNTYILKEIGNLVFEVTEDF